MEKKIEYDIVQATLIEALIIEVQKRLDEGWQLQGGVASSGSLSSWYYQAMIKVTEAEAP